MKPRPALAVPVLLAGALVLPALAPTAQSATEVRHYLDAHQIGSAAFDGINAVDREKDRVATVGTTDGALPGETSAGDLDAFVHVTSADLGEIWTVQVGGSAEDHGSAVATNGSLVVAAGITETALAGPHQGSFDGWLRLFAANGTERWSKQIGTPQSDFIADVEITGDGIYAAGWMGGHSFVHKYSVATGDLLWEGDVPGFVARDLVVDDDLVYASIAHTTDFVPPSNIVALARTTGARTWRTRVISRFEPLALVTDGRRLYFAGRSGLYGNVLAYDLDGKRLWSTDHGSPVVDAAWDGTALMAVTRASSGVLSLVAIAPSGRQRWSRWLPDGLDVTDIDYHRRTYSRDAALYVAGSTDDSLGGPSAGGTDAIVARFVTYQPDAQARRPGQASIGGDWYGARHQRLVLEIPRGRTRRADLIAQNDGEVEQTLLLGGCRSHDGFRIRYLNGSEDVSSVVNSDGYAIEQLYQNDAGILEVAVSLRPRAKDRTACAITVTSATTGEVDRVILDLRRR